MNDFYAAFLGSLEKFERTAWPPNLVQSSLPDHYPQGKYSQNVRYIGNMSLGKDVEPTDIEAYKFVVSGGRLMKEHDIQG